MCHSERNVVESKNLDMSNAVLSVKDVSNSQYGFTDKNDNSKRREPTDYTKANYAYCEPIKINQTQNILK